MPTPATTSAMRLSERGEPTKRLPSTGRRWRSSPTIPRPTPIWALCWRAAGEATRRWHTTRGPSISIRERDCTEQPRRFSGRMWTGRGSDVSLPEGVGDQARLSGRPGQPRQRAGRLGRRDEATAQYRQALAVNPKCEGVHHALGVIMVGQGRFDEAMAHYRKALAIRPDYPEVSYNLGVILFQQGRVSEAVEVSRRALDLVAARGDTAMASALRARIQFYQTGSPPRQTRPPNPSQEEHRD